MSGTVQKMPAQAAGFTGFAPAQMTDDGRCDMPRKRKISSAKAMREAWEQYKKLCDTKTVNVTAFSAKQGEFISKDVPHPITYTIKGFCRHIGITEQAFYDTYAKDMKLESVIARMREDCELDAREKFENGTLNPKLAGLWMSNYGYTVRQDTNVSGLEREKSKLDDLIGQMRGDDE